MRSLLSSSGQSFPLERRVPLSQVPKRRKGTESVIDERFALNLWSEFSIGNVEFYYQVREEKRITEYVMDNKFALLFWPEEFHYARYGREEREQSLSWMRSFYSMVRVLHWEQRVALPVTEEKKKTVTFSGKKLALLFWSEFSNGNREFPYQVWNRRREKCPS